MVSLADGSPDAATVLPLARRILETARCVVDDAALLAAIREHAYLEGDFLLRSGKRSTLLPRQVPLRDRSRAARADRRAPGGAAAELEPDAGGSPAPSSARSRWPRPPRSPPASRS